MSNAASFTDLIPEVSVAKWDAIVFAIMENNKIEIKDENQLNNNGI